MIVLTLTDCPPSLRGDLTKWLLEINSGVYVGRVSARVRDQLWTRVQKEALKGRATMAYSSGTGEQRLEFRTHNSQWEPIDFDGIKLMLRPSSERLASRQSNSTVLLKPGFSKASKMRTAKRMSQKTGQIQEQSQYVVIDLETTGLSVENDEIIEFGAVRVLGQQVVGTFQALVTISGELPRQVSDLTGLSNAELKEKGRDLRTVLSEFLDFVGDSLVVAHHGDFDYACLRAACQRYHLPLFANRLVDTLSMSKRYVDTVPNYRLETMVQHFSIPVARLHRGVDDCLATMQLYEKLNEIKQNGVQ